MALGHRLVLVLPRVRRAEPLVRRLIPRSYLRSDVYWKLVALRAASTAGRPRWDRRQGLPAREDVVQDVEVPVDRLAEFMDVSPARSPIEPVWFCPLQQRERRVWDALRARPPRSTSTSASGRSVALEPGRARRRPQPPDRAARRGPRRPQVPVLHLVLRGGRVLAALRRTRLRRAEEDATTRTAGCSTSTPSAWSAG